MGQWLKTSDANEVLTLLTELLAKARTPEMQEMSWEEAMQKGLTREKNVVYWLNRGKEPTSLREHINRVYAEALESVRAMDLGDEPVTRRLSQVIASLPETFNDAMGWDHPDKDALEEGLWYFFEEYDLSFDLGDDGTDDMEADLALIAHLIKFQNDMQEKRMRSFDENPVYSVADWLVRSEILDEFGKPNLYMGDFGFQWAFVNEVAKNGPSYNAAVNWVLREIKEDN